MDDRTTNVPISGTDPAGTHWVEEQRGYFSLFMDGFRQPRAAERFTPREIMRRFYDMFKVMITSLPAHASSHRDYNFNHGRYLFALGEDDSARGLIAVNLLPADEQHGIAYTVTMLQFLLIDVAPQNQFSLRMFQLIVNLNGESEQQITYAPFGVLHNRRDAQNIIPIGVNVLLNELIQRTHEIGTTIGIQRTDLRRDQRVLGARNAGRAVGHFLQIYQDSYVQLQLVRSEALRLSGGRFFGMVQDDMMQLLEALSLIPFIADAANYRRVDRNSRFTINRNANPPRTLATNLAGLFRELEQNLTDRFLLYALAILEDDFGYNIATMTEEANNAADGTATTSQTEARSGSRKPAKTEHDDIEKRLRAVRTACRNGTVKLTMHDGTEAAHKKHVSEREKYHKRMQAFFAAT